MVVVFEATSPSFTVPARDGSLFATRQTVDLLRVAHWLACERNTHHSRSCHPTYHADGAHCTNPQSGEAPARSAFGARKRVTFGLGVPNLCAFIRQLLRPFAKRRAPTVCGFHTAWPSWLCSIAYSDQRPPIYRVFSPRCPSMCGTVFVVMKPPAEGPQSIGIHLHSETLHPELDKVDPRPTDALTSKHRRHHQHPDSTRRRSNPRRTGRQIVAIESRSPIRKRESSDCWDRRPIPLDNPPEANRPPSPQHSKTSHWALQLPRRDPALKGR